MSHKFIHDVNFHKFLIQCDQDLALEAQQKGCPHCGGRLHQADYPRSPLGMFIEFRDLYSSRLSFCCQTCRKRTTPPSLRFFGRRWYPAPLFMLICLLICSISDNRLEQIKRHFGFVVCESTWKRWRRWWKECFVQTPFWQGWRGLFFLESQRPMPLPRGLLNALQGTFKDKLLRLLQTLSPLTTRAAYAF
jgi:hypothetical protein